MQKHAILEAAGLLGITDRAEGIIERARGREGHDPSPESLLLSLIEGDCGVGRVVLETLGLKLDESKSELQAIEVASRGASSAAGSGGDALRLGAAEAKGLGHRYFGSEHLVLGLLQVKSPAGDFLRERTSVEAVQTEVIRLLDTATYHCGDANSQSASSGSGPEASPKDGWR
jgi:ATP-dependent Clp protease ATP-binding subunit ClpC